MVRSPTVPRNTMADSTDSADFKTVFDTLWRDYATLRWHWQQFKVLFAQDVRHVTMMNNVARGFFAMVQRLMLNEIVLGMARITDNEKSARHKNLCLKQIPSIMHICNSRCAQQNECTHVGC